jgi:hypothetical protein
MLGFSMGSSEKLNSFRFIVLAPEKLSKAWALFCAALYGTLEVISISVTDRSLHDNVFSIAYCALECIDLGVAEANHASLPSLTPVSSPFTDAPP